MENLQNASFEMISLGFLSNSFFYPTVFLSNTLMLENYSDEGVRGPRAKIPKVPLKIMGVCGCNRNINIARVSIASECDFGIQTMLLEH